jgi:hypothetical protein
MRRRWRCVLLALASCGSGDEAQPIDPAVEGACASYAEKFCATDERCWPAFSEFWSDGATCLERAKVSCISRLSAPGVKDTADRVVSCANALSGLSCDKYNDRDRDRWPGACIPPPGQLPDAAACIVAEQCQGSACKVGIGAPCGVCSTVSPLGGACLSEEDCFNSMPCANGICTAHPTSGEPCDKGARYCVGGTVCRNIDATGLGTCAAPLPEGAACGGEECDTWNGYLCDGIARLCKRGTKLISIGGTCSYGACSFFAYCGMDICKAKPREGQPCVLGLMDCLPPAHCIEGVCKIRDAAVCK